MKVTVKRINHNKLPNASALKSLYTKVGFPSSGSSASSISKAVWQEFGTRGGGWGGKAGPIPERPFMRTAFKENSSKYMSYMRSQASLVINNKISVDMVISRLGEMASGDIRKSISAWSSPALSPTTVRLKGSDKPLIHTGEMFGSVTYLVVNARTT